MYVTTSCRMSSTMDQIRAECLELSALELEKTAIIDFVKTRASANIDQSAPSLAKIMYDQ